MKKTLAYLLLAAGILSLAGCQKTGTTGTTSGDNTIRFGASAAAGTKTAYSDEITNNVERIDWVENDVLRIYSDKAAYRYDDAQFYSDYKVTSATASNEKSTAEVTPATGNGLVWGDEPDTYTFWGVYPSTDADNGAAGEFILSFPSDQDNGDAAINLPKYGYLLAEAKAEITKDHFDENGIVKTKKNGGTKDDVTLAFQPEFTAFEIELVSNDATITVNKFTLSSETVNLAGDYRVKFEDGSKIGNEQGLDGYKSITVKNLGEIAPAKGDNPAKKITFTIFAKPLKVNDLKISLEITVNGSGQTRSLKLTKDGTGVLFNPYVKHRLKGVALPSELWNIYYAPFSVDEWELLDTTTNLIVQ